MTTDDSYVCDRCGSEYLFINAYDYYKSADGEIHYTIQGWYGECDNQEMCERCWDSN